ncbi:MAG: mandelate racemase/muconate lactonizing enzyme family protein [Anaerolineaceae bacterium]|nr:mandelate racemase/muconate lactonizing enzyme family protein [Anaerolineaceae bacterium]MDE0329025.1 mandelate racemase/muconate lactonizing enzyme family protein [Anaerolineaceae bacterium]
MSIESIDAIPVRLRRDEAYLGATPPHTKVGNYYLRPPYRCLYSETYETVFVRLRTTEGLSAWGEALAPVAPEVVCNIIEQLLAPALIGREALGAGRLWHLMYDLMRDRGYYGGHMLDAISALDIALWDAAGKLLNQPVRALIGGAFREDVPCYVSGLPRPTDDERVDLALDWQTRGFHAFKLAAGYGVRADVTTTRRLREALEEDTTLLLDAHWAYTVEEALQLGRRLEDLEVGFFEAPINPEDIAGHARLRDGIAIPVAVGETERTRYQFRPWLEQRAISILQPDIGRAGISESMVIAQMAEAFNARMAPHLSVGLGPCIAASIQLAAALPNLYLLEYQPPVVELANSLLQEPLEVGAGRFIIPDGPGLGVELDLAKVRAANC